MHQVIIVGWNQQQHYLQQPGGEMTLIEPLEILVKPRVVVSAGAEAFVAEELVKVLEVSSLHPENDRPRRSLRG